MLPKSEVILPLTVLVGNGQHRRARLAVPTLELAQITAGNGLHAGHEVITGYRFAIIRLEIMVCRLAEILRPQQVILHANNFRALFINGQGVEVINLLVFLRTNGVSHGPLIFRELVIHQEVHVLHPLNGSGIHVRRKLLIAKDRKPFFQT